MQINISGHHIDLTDSMTDYVNTKFERLERHFDHVTQIHVVLEVEKNRRQKAEATLHVSGADIHAESTHDDMYAAIDTLTDKLDRQILKYKEKKSDHRGSPAPELVE